jgi:hypothetical protein
MSDTLNEEQLFAQQIQIRTTGIQHLSLRLVLFYLTEIN